MAQDTTDPITIKERSPLILEATHTGEMNFTVEMIDLESGDETLVFNAVSDFSGRSITPVDPGEYVFNVNYADSYSLEPIQIDEEDVRELPIEIAGQDWDIIPVRTQGPYRFSINSQGADSYNYTVNFHDENGMKQELLINVVGSGQYATTVTTVGFGFLFVQFDGDWTIKMEEL